MRGDSRDPQDVRGPRGFEKYAIFYLTRAIPVIAQMSKSNRKRKWYAQLTISQPKCTRIPVQRCRKWQILRKVRSKNPYKRRVQGCAKVKTQRSNLERDKLVCTIDNFRQECELVLFRNDLPGQLLRKVLSKNP